MAADARAALLAWYDAHKRDLPWRRTRDPYAIWVSEIMCQQTRVDTVIPYYHRFLERFPTAAELAAASEDEVLGLWSGLGYYRRARLLHRGVKEVVATYGGKVPAEREARLGLPGVGKYTAGAIGSIAFDAEEPIVDGNVARVLARRHRVATPLGAKETEKRLWELAGELVKGPRPGDLNQALMELGATVCTPKNPRCEGCPVQASCGAHAAGEVDALPVPKKRKKPKLVHAVAVVATVGTPAKVWLVRGERALFGGLWSVPMVETAAPQLSLLAGPASARGEGVRSDAHADPKDAPAGRDAAFAALANVGVKARVKEKAGYVEHVLSHRHLKIDVWRAVAARGRDGLAELRAATREEVGARGFGVSRLTKKILDAALG
ncbi:MAG TPA: A/G-specific adenine glycosylase [Polyangiaceae bacterium LLY-WYZ-15_(1-7)]|nr:A/G-specific adenine glycosylase [Myxococcales bacterium]MAT24209.1 A/G-specific adenine glycosylase [Sandaracinus sp.]HJL03714.1 A/G-specific adenine glycosylase [Polyangiaceae bacterium LLY-WYZ-15_(1-7)]MBJ71905.1 A/G-specific adenine glycosylase [Sandaracinus sp.]HJL08196.1 A/G-specific adenine glycosylase [Polyangiaceae bacterium LLY-WYZ-15_(1-7)]